MGHVCLHRQDTPLALLYREAIYYVVVHSWRGPAGQTRGARAASITSEGDIFLGRPSCSIAKRRFEKENGVMKIKIPMGLLLAAVACLALGSVPAFAQSSQAAGKLKVHVSPKQAYVFVDGKAIRDGSQTIELTAGSHSVGVDNYGYTPQMKNVDITAGKTTDLDVTLQPSGDQVNAPFGDIELKKGTTRARRCCSMARRPRILWATSMNSDNNFLCAPVAAREAGATIR